MGADASGWEFTDDRGVALRLPRRPWRVVAYVRAGAALLDLGVVPVAVYGSGHDGDALDPVKAGELAAAGVPYLGAGRLLDGDPRGALAAARPDLVVDVTYDGKSGYALDEAVADRLGVPLVALAVGGDVAVPRMLERFGRLAGALRESVGAYGGDSALSAAEAEVLGAAGVDGPAVLALSGAGPEQVHLARPHAWPELARLQELGVRFVEPGPGAGASWLTTDWERAGSLRPDVVLLDSRANAVRPDGTSYPAVWRAVAGRARLVPWNPETPPSPSAFARFFRAVAVALR